MKRRLAILLAWHNFSEYYSHQLAAAIADRYETTIGYPLLDWNDYDVVICFFPQRRPGCDPRKLIKLLWEPHEFGWATDANTIVASCRSVYERILTRATRVKQVRWGVNPTHFHSHPMPEAVDGVRKVGWAGLAHNPRKQFPELKELVEGTEGLEFTPNVCRMVQGTVYGDYEVEGMGEYYRRIHLYACSSVSEGLGFPLLEASACGRGVVTFDVGIARELQESGAGIVIVEGFEDMREALLAADFEALGAASARAVAESWTWAEARDGWLDVLDGAGV